MIFFLVVFIFLSLYVIFLLFVIAGWANASHEHKNHQHEKFLTVIVAVRNESHNIRPLIKCLQNQQYPNYEVIFVDDHSTDNTYDVIQKQLVPNMQIISSPGSGKKQAISAGLGMAKGEIIVTTDADCSMGPSWLSKINQHFSDDVTLLIGPVAVESGHRLFDNLQSLEFSTLVASTAAAVSFGEPLMCNGANLAYRKSVFKSVNGYQGNEHIASGDDEFLLRKIKARFPGSVHFLHNNDAVVTTAAKASLSDFVDQRIRWASKWKSGNSIITRIVALFVFLVQLSTVVAWAVSLVQPTPWLLAALIAKVFLEAFLILKVQRFLGQRFSPFAFLVLQVLYPFYVVFIGIVANFKVVDWKGRPVNV